MNSQSVKKLLQKFPIFKGLSDYEMDPIVDIANQQMFPRGSHVFMQGDTITNVYFIHKGKVKIYKTDLQGKEQIVNVLQPGDMFPHQGFFRQDNYPAHAETSKDTLLTSIQIDSFEKFLITHPEICIKLFRILGDIIVDLQNRLQEKILHSTYEQIIMLLLRLSNSHGIEENNGLIQISAKFTNRELANMIGSSRETVSRTLTKLKSEELISTNKNGHLILDTEALEKEMFL